MKTNFKKHPKAAKYFLFLALILSFLSFSGLSYGFQGQRHQNEMGRSMMFMRFHKFHMLARELHLTRTQMKKLRKLQHVNFRKMMKARSRMESPMLAAVKNGSFDKQAFKSAALKNLKLMIKMRAARMENFFNILTPEQKKEFIIILKIKNGDWSWNSSK